MNAHSDISIATIFMPDGSPAPYLLTPDEAARFLRIDGSEHPENTLRYYQEKGLLNATYISKCRFFSVNELVKFIERVTRSERTVQDDFKSRNLQRC